MTSPIVRRTKVQLILSAVRGRPVTALVAAIAAMALLAGLLVVIRLSDETTHEALTGLDRFAADSSE